MDGYVKRLRNSKKVEGKSIIIPGEDRKLKNEEAALYGIELTSDVVGKLEILFGEKLKRE